MEKKSDDSKTQEALEELEFVLEFEKKEPVCYVEYAYQSWILNRKLKETLGNFGIFIQNYFSKEKWCYSYRDKEGHWENPNKQEMLKLKEKFKSKRYGYGVPDNQIKSRKNTPYSVFSYFSEKIRQKNIAEIEEWIKQISEV